MPSSRYSTSDLFASLITLVKIAICAAVPSVISVVPGHAQSIASHKDRLFAYPAIISESLNGDHIVVDYQEMRDINGRDQVPERRVKNVYVSMGVRRHQTELQIETPAGPVKHFAIGKRENAAFILVYLHGKGGNRLQGVNDYTFGGNFNRLKNIIVQSNGLYLVPDFADFEARGQAQIESLVDHYAAASPRARIILACGSMGGALCYGMADSGKFTLDGMVMLGSMWHSAYLKSAAFKARTPIIFAHGSRDPVFAVEKQEAFFQQLRDASPGYPTRFIRFETGNHGTPIRMIDWRSVLGWIMLK
ncbi:alpha/beta hydrolase [Limoniibacter endophyticus]|uniref:Phospholipase n=1 Tax=Limoniibacter endophyticus TaxID=1565040 RepID=A0A8J3DEH3_9HYPH|nr:alpha/beta hydrolase [Limoniibacter endophyticus]GHC60735.1 phospholipase [Limoniibacter endophyticus]